MSIIKMRTMKSSKVKPFRAGGADVVRVMCLTSVAGGALEERRLIYRDCPEVGQPVTTIK